MKIQPVGKKRREVSQERLINPGLSRVAIKNMSEMLTAITPTCDPKLFDSLLSNMQEMNEPNPTCQVQFHFLDEDG
jgi:hypothetical protein